MSETSAASVVPSASIMSAVLDRDGKAVGWQGEHAARILDSRIKSNASEPINNTCVRMRAAQAGFGNWMDARAIIDTY